jgi:hypothetical protein
MPKSLVRRPVIMVTTLDGLRPIKSIGPAKPPFLIGLLAQSARRSVKFWPDQHQHAPGRPGNGTLII